MTNPRKQLVERVAKAICPQIYGSWQESSPVERLHALDVAEDAVHVIQPKRTKAGRAKDTMRLEAVMRWAQDAVKDRDSSKQIWASLLLDRQAIDAAVAAEKKQGRRKA